MKLVKIWPDFTSIDLSANSFQGEIPEHLNIFFNTIQFSGQINEVPITNLSNLYRLDLSGNRIVGPIPNFFFHFRGISTLSLSDNLFNGTFKPNNIQSFPSLSELILSNNNLSVDTTNMSSSLHGYPYINTLHLSSCNLYDFPADLRIASGLEDLDLSNNSLQGDIPSWIWETEKIYLDLSFNLLTGLKKPIISPNFIELAHPCLAIQQIPWRLEM